jgi:hypothetical protein
MYSEEFELPGAVKVRIDYDLTEDGRRWCAVLEFGGLTIRGIGDDRPAAKAEDEGELVLFGTAA